jgi:hypothetical protein
MKTTITKYTYKKEYKMLTKHTLCYKIFSKYKHIQKTKIEAKKHNNRQNINICIRKLNTNKER